MTCRPGIGPPALTVHPQTNERTVAGKVRLRWGQRGQQASRTIGARRLANCHAVEARRIRRSDFLPERWAKLHGNRCGVDAGQGPARWAGMPDLTDFQLELTRLFFSLPASKGFLLAGGAALLA